MCIILRFEKNGSACHKKPLSSAKVPPQDSTKLLRARPFISEERFKSGLDMELENCQQQNHPVLPLHQGLCFYTDFLGGLI